MRFHVYMKDGRLFKADDCRFNEDETEAKLINGCINSGDHFEPVARFIFYHAKTEDIEKIENVEMDELYYSDYSGSILVGNK